MSPVSSRSRNTRDGPATELGAALASCRGAFVATGLISGMSNLLMLTGAIFMLEVYDRVLPSRSVPTLVGLVILAVGLYVALGMLDLIRARILVRIGISLDEALSGRIYQTIVRLPSIVWLRNDGSGPMRDLDSIRSFLGSLGPVALFDLPCIPLLDRHHGHNRRARFGGIDPADRMARAQAIDDNKQAGAVAQRAAG